MIIAISAITSCYSCHFQYIRFFGPFLLLPLLHMWCVVFSRSISVNVYYYQFDSDYIVCLVVWDLGMSSSQLGFIYFSEGQKPTTNQISSIHHPYVIHIITIYKPQPSILSIYYPQIILTTICERRYQAPSSNQPLAIEVWIKNRESDNGLQVTRMGHSKSLRCHAKTG